MSASVIDIEALLLPISQDNPAGCDLREDPTASTAYHTLKDARMSARHFERDTGQAVDSASAKKAWQQVKKMSQALLKNQSKDLEIAAWLIESLLRLHDFAGLRDGFLLVDALLWQYWPQLYPRDNKDIAARVSSLGGLNGFDKEGTLIVPISSVAITQDGDAASFALWEYQQALAIDRLDDAPLKQKRIEAGGIALERIKTAVNDSGEVFYELLQGTLQEAIAAFSKMTDTLEKKCHQFAPPSSYIKQSLESYQEHLHFILKDRLLSPQDCQKNQSHLAEELIDDGPALNSSIKNRQQALAVLLEIADYFSKTEPHSPLPSILRRAARWGNLSFSSLLKEVVDDEKAREQIFSLTGVEAHG
jgi:type VI secretion system protein ImpA